MQGKTSLKIINIIITVADIVETASELALFAWPYICKHLTLLRYTYQ